MLIPAIAAFSVLFAAQSGDQNASSRGNQEIDRFLTVLSQGKLTEAEAMVVTEPVYRDEIIDKNITLPKDVFLNWLGHCRKGIYMNIIFPTAPDGTETRVFHLECQKRGSTAASLYSEKIAFFVSSKGDGIKIH